MSKFFFFFVFLFVTLVLFRLVFFYAFPLVLQKGERVDFETTIFSDPKIVGNVQQLTVRYGNFWQSVPITVILSTKTPLGYGDTVEISGTVVRKMLKDKQQVLTVYSPQIKAKSDGILPILTHLRTNIEGFCEKTFSQPYSSLMAGMILGIKNTLPETLTRSFRITGVSHVVAASGMNVTLVAGFLMSFLARLFSRRLAVSLSLFGVVGYMLLSGLDPSILRAGVMGMLVFGSQLFGRQYTGVYSLFLTTGLLLVYDPLLLTDVGFQLSVLSTLGIMFLKPLVPLKGFLLDDVGTTVAAQVATLPLLLGTFGSYGMLSILVNALVLWTIPVITIVGGIGITLGLIFQPIGQLFLYIIFPLLWYFVGVVNYFANFHAVWQIHTWPVFLTVGYYLLVLSFVMLRRGRKSET